MSSLRILALSAALLSGCDCGGRPVTGAPGEIAADPASLDFGLTVPGRPVERSVAISNQGAGPLIIQELVIAGDAAAFFSVKPPDSSQLSGGESLSLIVSYAPSAEGIHQARLLVRSDAANTRELAISMNGSAALGDPCAKITCNSPPPCFKGGTCVGGACQYQPNAGALCDDGDPCTTVDTCSATGACAGTPKSCQSPQASACVDAQTSRTYDAVGSCGAGGACSYVSHDAVCSLGCDAATGQCKTGCGAGTHLCAGVCVSDSSVASCGTSCAPCPTDPNGTASCNGTSCGMTCNAGFSNCATGCCSGTTATTATAISAGGDHTCALTSTGGLKCWGSDLKGQIGCGSGPSNRLTPTDVIGFASGAQAVSVGGSRSCALTSTGGVKCWGVGQIGDGTTLGHTTPVDVVGLTSGVQSISAGSGHTCALTTAGGIKCWGSNSHGQIGDGTSGTDRLTPVDVVGLGSGVRAISVGFIHTCALTSAGGVKCWGWNPNGAIGDGTSGTDRLTPVDVVGLSSGVQSISAGGYHTCALTSTGGVKCWGFNTDGELGDGTTTGRLTPVDVVGLASGAQAVSAGGSHSCALTSAGGVKCWGLSSQGQLGVGTTVGWRTPGNVVGLASGVQSISAGVDHTCALTGAGALWCWGYNLDGEVGDGTSTNRLTPVSVVGF